MGKVQKHPKGPEDTVNQQAAIVICTKIVILNEVWKHAFQDYIVKKILIEIKHTLYTADLVPNIYPAYALINLRSLNVKVHQNYRSSFALKMSDIFQCDLDAFIVTCQSPLCIKIKVKFYPPLLYHNHKNVHEVWSAMHIDLSK